MALGPRLVTASPFLSPLLTDYLYHAHFGGSVLRLRAPVGHTKGLAVGSAGVGDSHVHAALAVTVALLQALYIHSPVLVTTRRGAGYCPPHG